VVDEGQAVGIVSLGDLAVERDPGSALGKISGTPPNKARHHFLYSSAE
jgi:hypothetical protein